MTVLLLANKASAVLVLLLVAPLGACTPSVQTHTSSRLNSSLVTPICSLVGTDAPPTGTTVRVRAFFVTDYQEHSVITDPPCPTVRLALYPDKAATKEEAARYQQAIVTSTMRDYIEDRRTGVYAIDVTGRFVYRKNEQPQAAIYADHVWSFRPLLCTAFYSAAECKGMDGAWENAFGSAARF